MNTLETPVGKNLTQRKGTNVDDFYPQICKFKQFFKKVPIFVTNWWHFEGDHGFNWIFRFIKTDGNSQRSKERREK